MKRYLGPNSQKDIWPFKKRSRLKLWFFATIFIMFVIAVGCGKRPIHVGLISSQFLNLDDTGSALSVVVRIYQLKAIDGIEKADFMSVWKSDKELLGEDLLDRKEVTLHPESKLVVELLPDKEAAYLAVVALFRKPQGDSWRKVIPLKDPKVRRVEVTVHERSVKLARTK